MSQLISVEQGNTNGTLRGALSPRGFRRPSVHCAHVVPEFLDPQITAAILKNITTRLGVLYPAYSHKAYEVSYSCSERPTPWTGIKIAYQLLRLLCRKGDILHIILITENINSPQGPQAASQKLLSFFGETMAKARIHLTFAYGGSPWDRELKQFFTNDYARHLVNDSSTLPDLQNYLIKPQSTSIWPNNYMVTSIGLLRPAYMDFNISVSSWNDFLPNKYNKEETIPSDNRFRKRSATEMADAKQLDHHFPQPKKARATITRTVRAMTVPHTKLPQAYNNQAFNYTYPSVQGIVPNYPTQSYFQSMAPPDQGITIPTPDHVVPQGIVQNNGGPSTAGRPTQTCAGQELHVPQSTRVTEQQVHNQANVYCENDRNTNVWQANLLNLVGYQSQEQPSQPTPPDQQQSYEGHGYLNQVHNHVNLLPQSAKNSPQVSVAKEDIRNYAPYTPSIPNGTYTTPTPAIQGTGSSGRATLVPVTNILHTDPEPVETTKVAASSSNIAELHGGNIQESNDNIDLEYLKNDFNWTPDALGGDAWKDF